MAKLQTPSVRERIFSGTDDISDLGAPVGLGSRATSFYERTQSNYTFRPLTAGGIRQSIFVLVQTSLGGGILTIAFMMRLSGIALGTLLLMLAGLIAAVSMEVLMKAAVMRHRYTLGSLMSFVFGQGIGVALDLMLFLYGNGSLITYLIFLGDFIPTIFQWFWPGTYSEAERDELRTRCLVGALLLVSIASLPRDLSGLRFLSPVMAIGIFYTEVIVVVKCAISNWPSGHYFFEDLVEEWRKKDITWWQPDVFSTLQAFSLSVFSYACHLNVTPVAKELVDPNDRRIEKISYRVVGVQFLIYLLLAVGGYLTFGDKTAPNLLTNYPANDPWILASRVGLTFTVLVAVATNTNPTVRACLCLLEVIFPSLKESAAEGLNTELLLKTPPLVKRPPEEPQCRRYLRYFLSIACLTMDTLVAICVRDVASVVGFLGATMGTLMMMMVIPGFLVYKMDIFSTRWSRFFIFLFICSATANGFAVFH